MRIHKIPSLPAALSGIATLAVLIALLPLETPSVAYGQVGAGEGEAEEAAGVAEATEEIAYIQFRHIFVGTLDAEKEEEKAAKRARAEEALELVRGGKDFQEVAREYSEMPRKEEQRGTLRMVPPGKLNPEIEKVLLTLEDGELSDIVETKYGYEIFRLEDLISVFRPAPPPPTPTPMFEYRAAQAAVTCHAFRPERSTIPYYTEDGFLWTPEAGAAFYAPIQIPDGAEIIGFAVWVRDHGGEERPLAELLASRHADDKGGYTLIGAKPSDGPWPPGDYGWCHFPGAKYKVYNGGYGVVLRVTLQSGDRRQAIRNGIVVYGFTTPAGATMGEDGLKYIAETQSHPGHCPQCAARKAQRERTWKAYEKEHGISMEDVIKGSAMLSAPRANPGPEPELPACCAEGSHSKSEAGSTLTQSMADKAAKTEDPACCAEGSGTKAEHEGSTSH